MGPVRLLCASPRQKPCWEEWNGALGPCGAPKVLESCPRTLNASLDEPPADALVVGDLFSGAPVAPAPVVNAEDRHVPAPESALAAVLVEPTSVVQKLLK